MSTLSPTRYKSPLAAPSGKKLVLMTHSHSSKFFDNTNYKAHLTSGGNP